MASYLVIVILVMRISVEATCIALYISFAYPSWHLVRISFKLLNYFALELSNFCLLDTYASRVVHIG